MLRHLALVHCGYLLLALQAEVNPARIQYADFLGENFMTKKATEERVAKQPIERLAWEPRFFVQKVISDYPFELCDSLRIQQTERYIHEDVALRRCKRANLRENAEAMYAALIAIDKGFMDGSIKFSKKRQSDSDPYHPASTLLCQALESVGHEQLSARPVKVQK